MILAAVHLRAALEELSRDEVVWTRLQDAVARHQLANELEPPERELIQAPVGALAFDDVRRASWQVEGLAALSWALGLVPWPAPDQAVDTRELLLIDHLLDERSLQLAPRSAGEVARARSEVEALCSELNRLLGARQVAQRTRERARLQLQVASERRRALRWLCGEASSYSQAGGEP